VIALLKSAHSFSRLVCSSYATSQLVTHAVIIGHARCRSCIVITDKCQTARCGHCYVINFMSISSDRLESAASYISTSPALSKVSNDVKLEVSVSCCLCATWLLLKLMARAQLYALYKCITIAKNPQSPRPSLFDFTGRAKWDAWDKLGRQSDEPEPDVWRQRYLEIAESLGWKEGVQQHGLIATGSTPSKAPNTEAEKGDAQTSGGGMGVVVSAMSQPPLDPRDHGTLHGFALSNDAKGLSEFLDARSKINLDSLDEYVILFLSSRQLTSFSKSIDRAILLCTLLRTEAMQVSLRYYLPGGQTRA
jgi:acyl-CoA-binding domain-containing protein 6